MVRWYSAGSIYSDDRGVRRPWLLRVFYICSILSVPLAGIGVVSASFNYGSFEINGRSMSGHEFLRAGGWTWMLMFLVGGSAVARTLRGPSALARPTLVLGLIALFGFAVLTGARPDASQWFFATLYVGGLAWYLYLKDTSRAYFGPQTTND